MLRLRDLTLGSKTLQSRFSSASGQGAELDKDPAAFAGYLDDMTKTGEFSLCAGVCCFEVVGFGGARTWSCVCKN